MNTPELPQKKSADKQGPRIRKSVMLSPGPHRQLEKMAKQLKTTNTEFMEAAIAYFNETGQSPFAAGSALQAGVEHKVEQQAQEIRQHNEDTSHQLGAIMRDAERGLGKQLQEQQGGTLLYLERIERNILKYLTQLEEKMLLTLLQQVMHISVETTVNRGLLELLLAKHRAADFPVDPIKLAEYAESSKAEIELGMIEKKEQLANITKLAPVFPSEKPTVAAASQPNLLPLKKPILGKE